jgi:hypothetical protein
MSELPTSALGVVKLFPESKQQVEIFSAQLVESVKHGLVNPLALKSTHKMIELVI